MNSNKALITQSSSWNTRKLLRDKLVWSLDRSITQHYRISQLFVLSYQHILLAPTNLKVVMVILRLSWSLKWNALRNKLYILDWNKQKDIMPYIMPKFLSWQRYTENKDSQINVNSHIHQMLSFQLHSKCLNLHLINVNLLGVCLQGACFTKLGPFMCFFFLMLVIVRQLCPTSRKHLLRTPCDLCNESQSI